MSEGNVKFSRSVNMFEGSWVFRADYLKAAPVGTHPTYIDHPVYVQTLDAGLLATTEFEGRTSYIYRWATGRSTLAPMAAPPARSATRQRPRLAKPQPRRAP